MAEKRARRNENYEKAKDLRTEIPNITRKNHHSSVELWTEILKSSEKFDLQSLQIEETQKGKQQLFSTLKKIMT